MHHRSTVSAIMWLVAVAPWARSQDVDLHEFTKRQLSTEFLCEGATFGDFDQDGKVDVVSGPYLYRGPDFSERTTLYPPKTFDPKNYSDNFFGFARDFDRDGWLDLLVIGFPGKDASWFRNPAKSGAPWKRHVVFDGVDNESPTFTDLTGDGIPEIVCQHKGRMGFVTPQENDPARPWSFHPISAAEIGGNFTHGLGVGDVNGDGRKDILWKKGWWEQPAKIDAGGEWRHHPAPFGQQGGAQMYVDDVDQDGDADVITSLNAHAYGLAWFEQVAKDGAPAFVEHLIMGETPDENAFGVAFGNLHALDLIDMDGDGKKDIVTGNRYWAHSGREKAEAGTAPIWWFARKGSGKDVEFVPHLIDADSGVGTQVVAGDLDGDGLPEVVVGNKKGTFVHHHKKRTVSAAAYETAPVNPPRQSRSGGPNTDGELPKGRDGQPLNLDFETGDLRDWTPAGPAFEGQPIKGDTVFPRRNDMKSRHQGNYWAGTFEPRRSDAGKGTLTSVPFTLTHSCASFLVGGGRSEATRVEIVDASTKAVLHRESGRDREDLRRVFVDVGAWKGKEVFLRVVDDATGHWGHVNFDDFRLLATQPAEDAAVAETSEDQTKGFSASEAVKRMKLPDGFHAEVVAAEPDLHQPIAFTIDAKGRLWVAEAFAYPIRAKEGEGRDTILVLADNDGNGTFETRTVFATGLNLVSGIEVGFGGVYIGAAPQFLFIPDRDDDLKPDGPPEVLLDGFGFQDTHETLNSFIWGPDGWLYGCHGVFTHSKVGKPGSKDGERIPMNAAVWRWHPTREEFEIFASGASNQWGVDFDDRGQAFITACVIPHLFHVIQGGFYERQAGEHFDKKVYDDIKTIADHRHYVSDTPHGGNGLSDAVGGGHAHCGAMIYLGGSFPESWRGRIFMNNIHGNRTITDVLEPSGSGYIGRHGGDFMVANDRWFRGLYLRYGPDGSVFVNDWYDRQACHRTDPGIWDRTNGRIYKLVYGAPKPAMVDLAALPSSELVGLQLHRNDWYCRTARRILQERGPDPAVHLALERLLDEQSEATRRLRALWCLHVTGGLEERIELRLLSDVDPHVRSWAIQLACERRQAREAVKERFVTMAREDSSPIVQLYLASALQRVGTRKLAEPIIQSLATLHPAVESDPNLARMLWYTPALHQGFADSSIVKEIARTTPSSFLRRSIWRRFAEEGGPGLDLAINELESTIETRIPEGLDAILTGLRGRRGVAAPPSWNGARSRLIASKDFAIRDRVLALSAIFGDTTVIPLLRERLVDSKENLDRRRAALEGLRALKDGELPARLVTLLADNGFRGTAIRALGEFDAPEVPAALLARFADFNGTEQSDAVAALATRPASAMLLLRAVESGRIPKEILGQAAVRRSLANLKNPGVDGLLAACWGRTRPEDADKKKTIDRWVKKFPRESLGGADLAHGRALFVKTCNNCHVLHGTGRAVGPDITGSNRSDPAYLLANVLDPSAEVAKEYQVTVIEMTDGRMLDGILVKEDQESLTMHLQNETVLVRRAEVGKDEEGKPAIRLSENSMMPDDQLAAWSDSQVRDLLAYLASPSETPLRADAKNKDRFFDGRSLAFWTADAAVWSVSEGEIVGKSGIGLKKNDFAVSHLVLKDFRLTLKVKLTPDAANSGIQFRSRRLDDGEMQGFQADAGKGWWGKLCEEQGRGLLEPRGLESAVKPGDWNTYEILATGNRVQLAINGVRAVDRSDPDGAREGQIGLQVHSGGPTEVRFKDFELEIDPEPVLKTVR